MKKRTFWILEIATLRLFAVLVKLGKHRYIELIGHLEAEINK